MLILRSLIIGAVLSVLVAGSVQAVPLYYTFTGEITGPWDSSRMIDEELYITFLIDTDVAFDNSVNNVALIDYSDNFIVRQGRADEVLTARVELDCLESHMLPEVFA